MKNHQTIIRVSEKMKNDIREISNALGFKETDMTRYLLNSAIQKIKSDSLKAGGFENLEITLRSVD